MPTTVAQDQPVQHAAHPEVDGIEPAVLGLQRQLNEMLATLPAPPDVSTPTGLAALRLATAPPQSEIASTRSDVVIDGPAGRLRLHVISPDVAVQAVVVRVHGGGWVAGAPEDDDTFNDALARACGVVVVSPEYRLVPEATVADGSADCAAAVRWVHEHAEERFGTARLLLAGNSAGASHAAQALLSLRDAGEPAFGSVEGVVLDCGMYDASGTPSVRASDEKTLVLPHDFLFGLIELGLPGVDTDGRREADVSPLYADLAGLPPALFLVGALDPLADDSRFMAARWGAAGNTADLDVWPEGVHAFANMNTPLGQVALTRIARWVNAVLAPERAGASTSRSRVAVMKEPLDPVAVVRRYLDEVVNGGSLDALREVWAPDGQWHGGSMGDRHGLAEMIAFASGGGAGAFSEMHLTVHDLVSADDKVVVRFTNSGRQTGPFLGAPATDRHATWLGIGTYTVTDGKITDAWFGEDILGMLLQLGVVTLPTSEQVPQ